MYTGIDRERLRLAGARVEPCAEHLESVGARVVGALNAVGREAVDARQHIRRAREIVQGVGMQIRDGLAALDRMLAFAATHPWTLAAFGDVEQFMVVAVALSGLATSDTLSGSDRDLYDAVQTLDRTQDWMIELSASQRRRWFNMLVLHWFVHANAGDIFAGIDAALQMFDEQGLVYPNSMASVVDGVTLIGIQDGAALAFLGRDVHRRYTSGADELAQLIEHQRHRGSFPALSGLDVASRRLWGNGMTKAFEAGYQLARERRADPDLMIYSIGYANEMFRQVMRSAGTDHDPAVVMRRVVGVFEAASGLMGRGLRPIGNATDAMVDWLFEDPRNREAIYLGITSIVIASRASAVAKYGDAYHRLALRDLDQDRAEFNRQYARISTAIDAVSAPCHVPVVGPLACS